MSAFIISLPALERNALILRGCGGCRRVPHRSGAEGVFLLALF